MTSFVTDLEDSRIHQVSIARRSIQLLGNLEELAKGKQAPHFTGSVAPTARQLENKNRENSYGLTSIHQGPPPLVGRFAVGLLERV